RVLDQEVLRGDESLRALIGYVAGLVVKAPGAKLRFHAVAKRSADLVDGRQSIHAEKRRRFHERCRVGDDVRRGKVLVMLTLMMRVLALDPRGERLDACAQK